MRKAIAFLTMLAITALPLSAAEDEKETERLQNCGKIVMEILSDSEHSLPQIVLDRATCVIVLPAVKKANGFIFSGGFGGTFGRGAMTCRAGEKFDGSWGAPTMVALEGFSWGLAAGGASADILILVMNEEGANSILTSKAKVGGNLTATAGPVGRDVAGETDAMLHSALLTFSRAKGLFAGMQLTGSTLRPDGPANTKVYGKSVDAKDVVLHSSDPAPAEAKLLLDTLNMRSPVRKDAPKEAEAPASGTAAATPASATPVADAPASSAPAPASGSGKK